MSEKKPQESKANSSDPPAKSSVSKSVRLKWLATAALVYSLWMVWLLYVGIINLRAGNQ